MLHLKERGLLVLRGPDSFNFLQRITTNDMRLLSGRNQCIYSLFLTPQGRLLYDAFIIHYGADCFVLDVSKQYMNLLVALLNKYKLGTAISIETLDTYSVFAIQSEQCIGNLKEYIIVKDPRHNKMMHRAIISNPSTAPIQSTIPYETYHMNRIYNKILDYTMDLEPNQFLLSKIELDSEYAVSYTKGCYIGQEVTARAHYQGKKQYKIGIIQMKEGQHREQTLQYKKLGVLASGLGLAIFKSADIADACEPIIVPYNNETPA